jgi:hypothetical protein
MTAKATGTLIIDRVRKRLADRFCAYRVLVDGVSHGTVRQGESLSIPLAQGAHEVQLLRDPEPKYTSPVMPITLDEDATVRCLCGPMVRFGLASRIAQNAPQTWIRLEVVDADFEPGESWPWAETPWWDLLSK